MTSAPLNQTQLVRRESPSVETSPLHLFLGRAKIDHSPRTKNAIAKPDFTLLSLACRQA
jgi:hypothetical protein